MNKGTVTNIPLLITSPTGKHYMVSSLRQCASFISHLHFRLTGNDKRFFDYKQIRHRIDFDNGEFIGTLAGWKITEFGSFEEMREYVWKLDGILFDEFDVQWNNGITE